MEISSEEIRTKKDQKEETLRKIYIQNALSKLFGTAQSRKLEAELKWRFRNINLHTEYERILQKKSNLPVRTRELLVKIVRFLVKEQKKQS